MDENSLINCGIEPTIMVFHICTDKSLQSKITHEIKLFSSNGGRVRREIRVFIIEEDPFAIHWMALILARDWRTQVTGEALNIAEALEQIRNNEERIDLLLLDADLATPSGLQKIKDGLKSHHETRILLVGNSTSSAAWKATNQNPLLVGYILKEEIRFSLAWAADFATDGHWVATPAVQNMASDQGRHLPDGWLVIDGRREISNFTQHEMDVARLALIFSMERRELADELSISDDWGYGLVTTLYKKLGLEELLTGEVEPSAYLGSHPAINERLEAILVGLKHSKKAKDLETLAFHLLTMPELLN